MPIPRWRRKAWLKSYIKAHSIETNGYSNTRCELWRPDDPPDVRHERRLDSALLSLSKIQSWCDFRGVEFKTCGNRDANGPHAVQFKFRIRLHRAAAVAGWIPGLGRAWRGICKEGQVPCEYSKVYDWEQMLSFLASWYDAAQREPK